jgi:hypothetical protein
MGEAEWKMENEKGKKERDLRKMSLAGREVVLFYFLPSPFLFIRTSPALRG